LSLELDENLEGGKFKVIKMTKLKNMRWGERNSISKNLQKYGSLAKIIYSLEEEYNSMTNRNGIGTFRLTEKWAWDFGRRMEVVQSLLSVSEFPRHYRELTRILEDKLSQLYVDANNTFLEYKKTPIGKVA